MKLLKLWWNKKGDTIHESAGCLGFAVKEKKKIMPSQFHHTWEKLHEHSRVWATVKPVDFRQVIFAQTGQKSSFLPQVPAVQTQRCQSSHTCRVYSRACTHLSSWHISPLCHSQIFLSVRYWRPRKRPHHVSQSANTAKKKSAGWFWTKSLIGWNQQLWASSLGQEVQGY